MGRPQWLTAAPYRHYLPPCSPRDSPLPVAARHLWWVTTGCRDSRPLCPFVIKISPAALRLWGAIDGALLRPHARSCTAAPPVPFIACGGSPTLP